jgi:hypothetical protein
MLTGPANRPAPRTSSVLTFVHVQWSRRNLDAEAELLLTLLLALIDDLVVGLDDIVGLL